MENESVFIIDWSELPPDDRLKRLNWCKSTLSAPADWGYCIEHSTLVLKNSTATTMYRLVWFDDPNVARELVDEPTWVKSINLTEEE